MLARVSSEAALQFRDIRKSFGAVQALRGVSFEVAAGEAHALMARTGPASRRC